MDNQSPWELEAQGSQMPEVVPAWWAGLEAQLQDVVQLNLDDRDERFWQLLIAWANRAQASGAATQARQVLVFWVWLTESELDTFQLVGNLQIPGALDVAEFVDRVVQENTVGRPQVMPGQDDWFYATLLADLTAQQTESLVVWCRQWLVDQSIQEPFMADCRAAWSQQSAGFAPPSPPAGQDVWDLPLTPMPGDTADDPMPVDPVVDAVPTFFFDEPIGQEQPIGFEQSITPESQEEEERPTKRRRLADPEPTGQVKLTEADWQLIAAVRHGEIYLAEISRQMGVPRSTVAKGVEELGIKLQLTGTASDVLKKLKVRVEELVRAGRLEDQKVSWPPAQQQPTGPVVLTEDDWQLIAAARNRIFSSKVISETLLLTQSAVTKRVEELGIKLQLTGTASYVLKKLKVRVEELVRAGRLEDRQVFWSRARQ